ncbi:KH domain-containing protein [Campylobacter upsaliensis]|uniref:RNA-binding protein n=1 Tax=Campylobacter upsaliensis TaxID=28080 RepID=A0A3S4WNV1_CAMUP|nr:KH domain-containing protein [Campylobacter upsaliensis]MDL0101726.1 KH domain-containing protein [Campylobacter felis]EAI8429538.1 KH domain-containing protein [Campylobacter upsaliensis]EAJ2423606.1 KH domain-containing protein [Campylobacter upsaliensis]EGK8066149.1 KH domain-containing protein [Campylobacter upsaliensis]EHJ4416253.1 KH domain-containing protein [Campylobacter upsaliensis]
MVEDFLKEYAKLIADYPERIDTQRVEIEENFVEIFLFTDKNDTGKLIGKNGKMINAIKTVISAYKSKENISYRVTVKALE